MVEKMTITRALTELKTLDKRIQKTTGSGVFISFQGKFHKPNEYSKKGPAVYQSVMDLLNRRKRIKSAIVSSNAVTNVKICGKEMTIAEAIETKSSIKHHEYLIGQLKRQYADANRSVENINARVRQDLEKKTTMEKSGE